VKQLKYKQFQSEVILLNVRWYLAYPLSYRNLEEMMRDRGLDLAHTSIYRWVQEYSKMLVKNFNRRKRPVSKSWRMDETYIKVRGKWRYLYRAVDKHGMTVDFMLSSKRDMKAAASFLCKAIGNNGTPEKVNIDCSGANTAGTRLYNEVSGTQIEINRCKYLNNIVEGDHFGIKKVLTSSKGFKRIYSARNTIYGAEVIRMIRKGQLGPEGSVYSNQFEAFTSLVA
jgi:putative transposase